MGENSGIMGWIRQRFGKLNNESEQRKRRKKQSSGSSVNSSGRSLDALSVPSVNSSTFLSSCTTSTGCMTPTCSPGPPSCPPCPGCSYDSSESLISQTSGQSLPPSLRTPFRFSCKYDVYVCHSEENISQALALVSFLESPSRGLRCYVLSRDCPLGGAVPTELCRAVQNSHCWVMLITPNFLKDEWCLYQMQQAICEGPMSQRIIPTVLDLHVSQIPRELAFFFSINLNRNREAGYTQVYRTVLQYLKEMWTKEEFHAPASYSCTEGHAEVDSKVCSEETTKAAVCTENVLN